MIRTVFDHGVLRRPWIPLLLLGALLAGAAAKLPGFRLDADSESLTLEHDPERDVYRETRALFGSDDYVILAMAPPDPWSAGSIAKVDALTRALEGLETVEVEGYGPLPAISGVTSPTNQRLFRSLKEGIPPATAVAGPITLASPETDPGKAREELVSSALYGGNLVSGEGDAFAIIATFADGTRGAARDRWTAVRTDPEASDAAREEAFEAFKAAADREQARIRAVVAGVRALAAEHGGETWTVHASGVPTIVVDMVNALEEDILLFGVFAVGFMVVVLAFALRRVRWVVLPMAAVLVVALVVVAATVVAGKRTTVVTSNLSSLLLIVGMAHAIHIAVHSREVRRRLPDATVRETVMETVRGIAVPCLYACLTTTVGFASIAVSDIRPNIDFGLFMAAGTLFAYAVSFTLIPAGMVLLRPEKVPPAPAEGRHRPMAAFGRWTLAHGRGIIAGSLVVFVLSAWGMSRLEVETRFTDYFRESSPISMGLDFIDRRIGGTTPLEVVLYGDGPGYFLEEENFDRIRRAHALLAALPEGGTVLSLDSLRREAGTILTGVGMGAMAKLPLRNLVPIAQGMVGKEEFRALVRDYVNDDYSVARLQVRIRETSPTLHRQALLEGLRADIAADPALAAVRPRVTGMFVLYTNMLRSLATSQGQTLGMVVAALFLMLWILFRDLRTAAIGLMPNVLPILFILGTMGWAGIALDMMTIMIASVSMGMAVDATIHYTFRYRHEVAGGAGPEEAVVRSHESIGRAILFTAFTVVGGFWVLVFSNFKPTIYFGMFTSLAMAAALLASLVLLPVLLGKFSRPAAPENASDTV